MLQDATWKLGGAPTKIGTHAHKEKKCQNMAVGATRCCRGVSLRVDRLQARWRWARTIPRWKGKKGTLNDTSRGDSRTKNYCTINSDNTDNFAQAAMFNVTTRLHTSPCFNNFTGRQGAPTPYLQQPTTIFHETATHMRISTHFTKVSRR